MTRRGFLRRSIGALAAAAAAPFLPAVGTVGPIETAMFCGFGPLTYDGKPFFYDRNSPRSTVYILDARHHRAWNLRTGEPLHLPRAIDLPSSLTVSYAGEVPQWNSTG